MKTNTYAIRYETLLENNPHFFDDYFDADQTLEVLFKDLALQIVEPLFDSPTNLICY